MKCHFAAAALFGLAALPVQAATVGLPIFTTAPATMSFTNEFIFNRPSPFYTLNYSSTIATAQGAPELVGQALDFTWFYGEGFIVTPVTPSLTIGGFDLTLNAIDEVSRFRIVPPVASEVPAGNLNTFTFAAPFQGFGPVTSAGPDILLQFTVNQPIPTLTGYLYCDAPTENAASFCEFSGTFGLTEIGGIAVQLVETIDYPEGFSQNATLTFGTEGGRAPAPVPLPAGAPLLFGALALLAAVRRGRSQALSRSA